MLVCTNCGAENNVSATFPEALVLDARVSVPGEVEAQLISELGGVANARLTDWSIRTVTRLSEVRLDGDDQQLRCLNCEASGTVTDGTFEVANVCRCGRRDDGLFICTRLNVVMCHNCRDRLECDECRMRECFFHRHYEGDESPPESTYTQHRQTRRERGRSLRSRRARERQSGGTETMSISDDQTFVSPEEVVNRMRREAPPFPPDLEEIER